MATGSKVALQSSRYLNCWTGCWKRSFRTTTLRTLGWLYMSCIHAEDLALCHSPEGAAAEAWGPSPLLQAILSPCDQSESRVHIFGRKSNMFWRMFGSAGGFPLSQFLLVISMIRTQSTAGGEDTVEFVDIKIASLLFACCRNPEKGGTDGLLMDFAIYIAQDTTAWLFPGSSYSHLSKSSKK